MPNQPRKIITEEQWQQAVETYELGHKHANEIARELGVSPPTVSRQFKRRGARKGCRVAETIVELVAELDERARRRALVQIAREKALMRRSAELDAAMDELMLSIIAATKFGSIASAGSTVKGIGKAIGVKGLR